MAEVKRDVKRKIQRVLRGTRSMQSTFSDLYREMKHPDIEEVTGAIVTLCDLVNDLAMELEKTHYALYQAHISKEMDEFLEEE